MLRFILKFYHCEEAQATTEYILMLSMMVAVCVTFLNKILKPVFTKVAKNLTRSIDILLVYSKGCTISRSELSVGLGNPHCPNFGQVSGARWDSFSLSSVYWL